MSAIRPSIFRDALQVSPERIASLGDEDLNVLMRQLLRATAYRCDSPLNEIRVNTEGKAKDDGSDGWSGAPTISDAWFGSTDTCWQFKAGIAGQPARLSGEVKKRYPRETLFKGGRFVVIASGSTNGKMGEDDRLATLVKEANALHIPAASIEVIGSDRLTFWCNQHPAVAACWAGRPDGLWSLDHWLNSEEHQVPWQAPEAVKIELSALRTDLDFAAGTVRHLHIQGPPGVGKTRLALELCREAAWRGAVIYIRQASDIRLNELIDSAAGEHGVQLMVVADEAQPEQLRPLRDSVGRCEGRVRLITIGHTPTPDPAQIPALSAKPLDRKAMEAIVMGWHPTMPPEHVDFVVRFADGYVRLAKLAAYAVAVTPVVDVRVLLSRTEVRGFLDGMLGPGDRRALYVVAALTSVGWTEDKQCEAEAVAKHLCLDWNAVRAAVEDFNRRLGIAPRSGRYRYISPTPLGIHLAVEAWTTFPDLLRSLPDALPSEEAVDAYYERLQSMASNPQAQAYAREELAFFFRLEDFADARTVRRWSALSAADPDRASRNIRAVLADATVDDRKLIAGPSRRECVWTLVRLAWRTSSFHNAVFALALLAEAENETWANNASSEFQGKFQIFLGGTAVPYRRRLLVLDELLSAERPSLSSLAVKALAQVSNRQAYRMDVRPVSDELPESEWRPADAKEHFECVEAAVEKLTAIARLGAPEVEADLLSAAEALSMMLREPPTRRMVVGFFDSVRGAYPEARESLRRIIARIVQSERNYWKQLSVLDLEELESIQSQYEDNTLWARLQQYVGQAEWNPEQQRDLSPLAEELLSAPETLSKYWPWLTSGEASEAWRLGEALAASDSRGQLADELTVLPGAGRDLRLLCGYICGRRRALGDPWYDSWLTAQSTRDPKPLRLLFELAWRCGATELLAHKLTDIIRGEPLDPQLVAQLGLGLWGNDLPFEVLEPLLSSMADSGYLDSAITVLARRINSASAEFARWKQLALQLVTSSTLVRSSQMTSYYWKEVAEALVADYPEQIAASILREQADRRSGTWFAQYSEAAVVLRECVDKDPNAVWRVMLPHLTSQTGAHLFAIGFPKGLIERMPAAEVNSWVAADPQRRAALISRLVEMDMSTDQTLAAKLVGEYGDDEDIASTFFAAYTSGSWWGPSSLHWAQLGKALEVVAARTELPKLRNWALDHARSLQEMAERDGQREDEQQLRGL